MIGLEEIPNTACNKYEIVKRIAIGGMAEIFLARTKGIEGFEKYVVLKKLNEVRAESERAVRMFLDEARLAALLHHHNIAQIHDMGQLDGEYFIAMEYLHGKDVRALYKACHKKTVALPLQHALTIAAGVAAGLQYAHTKVSPSGTSLDIVHRDVSPSNIFVTFEGGVKLVDFGIARAAERTVKTQEGALKGKVRYMSPEQVRGQPIDHRSDIFSLGIVLYEMTAMTRLFGSKHDSDFMVMERIVRGTIAPPSENHPDYPPALEAIVMRALAKDRDQRYSSARDMLSDIEEFAADAQLALSSSALEGFLQELFGQPREPWHALDESAHDPATRGNYVITLLPEDADTVGETATQIARETGSVEQPSHASASMPSLTALTPSALTALPDPSLASGSFDDPSSTPNCGPHPVSLGESQASDVPWPSLPLGASPVMLGDIKPDRRYLKWSLAAMALIGLLVVLYVAMGSATDDPEQSPDRPAATQPAATQPSVTQPAATQPTVEEQAGPPTGADEPVGHPDDSNPVARDDAGKTDEPPPIEKLEQRQRPDRKATAGPAERKKRTGRGSKSRKRRDSSRRDTRDRKRDDSRGSKLLDREW